MGKEYHMDPDDPPSLEEQGLRPVELQAKEHWERFLPRLVKSLLAKGGEELLEQEIRKAWWRKEYGVMLHLARQPQLHRQQVEELYREELFPPPERSMDRKQDAE